MNDLEKLLYLRRVGAEYFSYSGERMVLPYDLRLKYLQALGYDIGNAEAIRQAVFELDALPWKSWLRGFNIFTLGRTAFIEIRVPPDALHSEFIWQVVTESGAQFDGARVPTALEETGDYTIDGMRYSARRLPLPDMPIGYHQFTLSYRTGQASTVLAVAPGQCYEHKIESKLERDSLWGISCQVYTLRSARNWGIGDFSDLLELVDCCAASGMDFIGLNPLHAPNFSGVDYASPYSPSDRRFLNPLYIDPQAVAEFNDSKKINSLVNSASFKRKLQRLREAPRVDYQGVAELKYWAFEELYRVFVERHIQSGSSRAQTFHDFVARCGEPLQALAQFESCHGIGTVKACAEPLFHQYLQWLADQQMQACQSRAIAGGMKPGLMGDLAVGASQDGAEVLAVPNLFCPHATIGAPPDPFTSEGQDWSLPALDPIELERNNFQHYIQLLRANMAHCGALRIDHVMALQRLWWCLPGETGGAYVYYPMETLLAILCLESHRNRCLVIGEDMGVVPDEVRSSMAATAVYSNKVFYFERDYQQQFVQPLEHPLRSLLMVTNHDVPTLAGWWNSSELVLRARIGVLDTESELPGLLEERRIDKHRLLAWLQTLGLLPGSWSADQSFDQMVERPFDLDLCAAILHGCARSHSRLMSFQLDDLQLIEEPVNIPGTYREYPNWRRKQRFETQAIFNDPKVQALLGSTFEERKQ